MDAAKATELEVSVVLPCLNEAGSVEAVVRTAAKALQDAGIAGEVIVVDNGSTDGSAEIASRAGAKVVAAPVSGYGNAYHVGMAAATAPILVMADADGTYPMESIPDLVAPIRGGNADMVVGNRLHSGLAKSAMPWAHRYIGNPILTGLLNRMFGVKITDAHSGMRAITRTAYASLNLSTTGMEYASEMIVNAARLKLRVAEVPIEYGQRVGQSKLQTWPDGWRHLKFLLLASPNWLFIAPGLLLFVLGAILVIPLSFGEVRIGPIHLILYPMLGGSIFAIVGYQLLQFGILLRCAEPWADGERSRLVAFFRRLTLERALVVGGTVLLAGLVIGLTVVGVWVANDFGPLAFALRPALAAFTLFVLGTQTIFGAFLYAFFLPSDFAGGVSGRRDALR
jgi:glycosyltransferase involved in cell wall biosynthesis